ncbi:hypothetical protein GCM10010349_18270 [Streptomyces flavofungini]|nr:hypothetical protein GCM10010349_18270 [Streptomyces flavofungini]
MFPGVSMPGEGEGDGTDHEAGEATGAEGRDPGRVRRIEPEAERLARRPTSSRHELGLGEAVGLSRVLGRLPQRRVVYAVEGADTAFGTGLSPDVAAVVDPVASSVGNEIVRHRGTGASQGRYAPSRSSGGCRAWARGSSRRAAPPRSRLTGWVANVDGHVAGAVAGPPEAVGEFTHRLRSGAPGSGSGSQSAGGRSAGTGTC